MAAIVVNGRLGPEVLPVKNTFIHFSRHGAVPGGLRAARSCPDLSVQHGACCIPTACRTVSQPLSGMQGEEVSSTKEHTPKHTFPRDAVLSTSVSMDGSASQESSLAGIPAQMTRVPLSPYDMNIIESSFGAVPALPIFPPSSDRHSGRRFGFTLRMTGDVRLGVRVDDSACGKHLIIREVLERGAMAAWNGQCSQCAHKYVVPGDYLVDINGASDCDSMIQECREKTLLKMTILRPDNKHITSFPGMGQRCHSCFRGS